MNKLIFLDGVHVVGKSSVADCICEIASGQYICVDPDEYANNHWEKYGWYGFPVSNNRLIKIDVSRDVKNYIQNKNVIIPMTLGSQINTKEWTGFFRGIADVRHVVLFADRETVINRILNDDRRLNKKSEIERFEAIEQYYQGVIEGAVKINTSEMTLEEVARKILELVR